MYSRFLKLRTCALKVLAGNGQANIAKINTISGIVIYLTKDDRTTSNGMVGITRKTSVTLLRRSSTQPPFVAAYDTHGYANQEAG